MGSYNPLPPWPTYPQTIYSPSLVLGLFVVGGIFWAFGLPLLALLPWSWAAWKTVLAPLLCEVATWPIHLRWARTVGPRIGWRRVRGIVADAPGEWRLLVSEVRRGSVSFGTYTISGGRDDFVLENRRTGQRYVVVGGLKTYALVKARELGIRH